jgi:hypothetical protein
MPEAFRRFIVPRCFFGGRSQAKLTPASPTPASFNPARRVFRRNVRLDIDLAFILISSLAYCLVIVPWGHVTRARGTSIMSEIT